MDSVLTRFTKVLETEELEKVRARLAAARDDLHVVDWAAFQFYMGKDHEAAEELYQELVIQRPDQPTYHYYLANCLYARGDLRGAMRHWRLVLTLKLEGDLVDRTLAKLRRLAEDQDAVWSTPPRPPSSAPPRGG